MSKRWFALSIVVPFVVTTIACGKDVTGTQEADSQVFNLAGPQGLGQDLRVQVDPASFRLPGRHTLIVQSKVMNGSSQPVKLRARVCRFMNDDFQTTAELDRVDALATCSADEQTINLAPSGSVATVEQRFVVRSGPGSYQLTVRHALDPVFDTTVSFSIP